MREYCYQCFKPKAACFCKDMVKVDCGVKFVFLMHPKEAAKQKTGTGHLASIRLPESEILVGVNFTEHKRLNQLLNDPQYYPVMLYPGDDAWTADKKGFRETLGSKKLLVIIIDSTWFCSKKMIKTSENLLTIPKFSFSGNYKSIFTFKREPAEYCVSTIESCYYLIKELQSANIVNPNVDPEPLMDVFKKMIIHQLKTENERIESGLPGSHAYDHHYTEKKEIPDFEILVEKSSDDSNI